MKRPYPLEHTSRILSERTEAGGHPTAHDRIIAGHMGAASIEALLDGQRNVMFGIRNDEIVYAPFNTAIKKDKPIDNHLMNVLHMLSI